MRTVFHFFAENKASICRTNIFRMSVKCCKILFMFRGSSKVFFGIAIKSAENLKRLRNSTFPMSLVRSFTYNRSQRISPAHSCVVNICKLMVHIDFYSKSIGAISPVYRIFSTFYKFFVQLKTQQHFEKGNTCCGRCMFCFCLLHSFDRHALSNSDTVNNDLL